MSHLIIVTLICYILLRLLTVYGNFISKFKYENKGGLKD